MTKAADPRLAAAREAAQADLFTFAKMLNPQRLYGEIHKEVFDWLTQGESTESALLLMPRAHMKSHVLAVWTAWQIIKAPEVTILYLSATSNLAELQLREIKQILESDQCRLLWPDMLEREEGKREQWSNSAICVDHPARKREGTRDSTVVAAGLTTTTAGWHADIIVADDVVVPDNAYTLDGRFKVSAAMSQMESILNPGGRIRSCGTRYHPKDQYFVWKNQVIPVFDDGDEIVGEEPVWDIFERVVETDGVFLWPKEYRKDGKPYGFDKRILERKRAKYEDKTQFYAQYYNDPNEAGSNRLTADSFQYYDAAHLKYSGGHWQLKGRRLNLFAAMDFAYTTKKTSDYTAIVVVGIDCDGHIYVIDIDRFKTDRISVMYDHLRTMHDKYRFRKVRAEVVAAQSLIVEDLKDSIRRDGLSLAVEDFRPNSKQGSKEERMAAILEPRYDNKTIWHSRGGYTLMLEEELVLARPAHDDMKDALASVIEIAKAPTRAVNKEKGTNVLKFHSRFGGVCR